MHFCSHIMTQQKNLPSADALVDIALNAACFAVQEAVGQTDGGPASVFFSGSYETAFTKLFKPYCELELQDAEERAQDQKANSKPVLTSSPTKEGDSYGAKQEQAPA